MKTTQKDNGSVNLSRSWDSQDCWAVIEGGDKTIAQFRMETGADEDHFNNTGCLSMIPQIRDNEQPWMGSITFFKGWWFAPDGTKDMGGSWGYDASKSLPKTVVTYIRAAYEAGINPLPQLRKELPQVKWEYVSNSQFNRCVKTGTEDWEYSERFVQPIGQPVVLVAWDGNDFRDELAVAFWDGKCWFGDFDSNMLARLAGPKG